MKVTIDEDNAIFIRRLKSVVKLDDGKLLTEAEVVNLLIEVVKAEDSILNVEEDKPISVFRRHIRAVIKMRDVRPSITILSAIKEVLNVL